MSRLVGEPVKVHLDKEALPEAFIWRKRLYRVEEVFSWWREPAAREEHRFRPLRSHYVW